MISSRSPPNTEQWNTDLSCHLLVHCELMSKLILGILITVHWLSNTVYQDGKQNKSIEKIAILMKLVFNSESNLGV